MFEKVKLTPGILTLTFTAPPEGAPDAMIRPFVPPAARNAITLMFEPGNMSGALTEPGQFCVIRCGQPSVLGIEIVALRGPGQPRGGMELTYLSQRGPDPAPDAVVGADFVVHLPGQGDQAGRFGAWVGTDAAGAGIGGMMIPPRAGRPRVVLHDPATKQIATPGQFVGSRNGFRPLGGLDLWIDDPDGRARLAVQAEFALAGPVQATGTRVSLAGAGQGERLLRLCLTVEAVRTTGPADAASAGRGERIKIFRKA